jgi:hypothetical protein
MAGRWRFSVHGRRWRRTATCAGLTLCIAALLPLARVSPAAAETTVSCPFNGGITADQLFHGFYVTNYPGTNLDQVTLAYSPNTSGQYMITLTARSGTYDGPIIGTETATVLLTDTVNTTPVTFAFGGMAVAQGSTITFSQTGSGPSTNFYDTGVGPCPGVTETTGTTPPLDTFRGDSVGLTITQAPPAPPARPSNAFSFGKLKRNKKTGTGTLAVNVPGPGTLSLTGKGLVKRRSGGTYRSERTLAKAVSAAGTVKLKIKAKGKAKKQLYRTGTVKVKAKVTYTPTGGDPNTKSKRVKLIKRL